MFYYNIQHGEFLFWYGHIHVNHIFPLDSNWYVYSEDTIYNCETDTPKDSEKVYSHYNIWLWSSFYTTNAYVDRKS